MKNFYGQTNHNYPTEKHHCFNDNNSFEEIRNED